MWFLVTLCLLSLSGAIYGADEEIKLEDGVLVLTVNNFKTAISDNEFILVEFYAPWCGHCKSLAPEYAKAAQALADKGSSVKLGKVDATEEASLAEEFSVRGYPTLKFFRSGKPIDYTGGRQADDIVNWLTKKTGPPAVELDSADAIATFKNDNKVVVVGFFTDKDSTEAKTFLSIASAIDEYPFGVVNDKKLFDKQEAKDGAIILFKQFDEGKAVYEGKVSEDDLKLFVTVQSMPLIVEFNHDSAQKIFGGDIKSHLLFFLSKDAGHIEKYAEPSKELAKKYREKVLFVSINSDEEDHQRILEFFGMKKEEVPSMRLIRLEEDMAKYKPATADLSPKAIEEFVEAFLENKLKQHLLTQDLPEDWDKTDVLTLVSTNFDEVVFNKDKNVLVEFYAPWCGHCKQLAPIFDQLGEKYKDNDEIVIAKIDATANELEHTKITSFPTLKFYKKGDNAVIDYNGERTLEGFTKFLDAGGVEEEDDVSEEETQDDEHVKRDEL